MSTTFVQSPNENLLNPLQVYIDNSGIRIHDFAKAARISAVTVYRIYYGGRPAKKTAKAIQKATRGKLTIKDFGYE